MTETFDPKFVAQSIEWAGDCLLHGAPVSFNELLPDMGRLSPKQVKEVGNQLQWDNMKANGLPKVDMSVGVDGHVLGFTFTPALSDIRPAVSPFIMVGTGHTDSGVAPPELVPAPHKRKVPEFQH